MKSFVNRDCEIRTKMRGFSSTEDISDKSVKIWKTLLDVLFKRVKLLVRS